MSTFQETLKRLLSRNIVITKTKSGKLRTIDFNKSQSTGSPTQYQNRPKWKLSRGYSTTSGYGSGFTNEEIEALRKQMYQDYDIMDTDAIVSSVLDIAADESSTYSEQGELLVIKTNDEKIKKVLHNLFYDIMNLDFNLWPWLRTTCKYGDNFLYLQVAEGVGVVNVMPIHPILMIREEGINGDPQSIRFRYEGEYGQGWAPNHYFEETEIAHFRLLSDVNFLPYGRSFLEGGRQEFKRMRLMEDSMMLNRIMRAPERRLFKIDIGNIAPEEVDAYIEEISNSMKKTPYIDPTTGEMNLRYNLLNSQEDFFLPVRGSDSGTSIETLPGLQNDKMLEDVEYFKNKMIAAFKVPKDYIGYGGEENGGTGGKCIHPETKIPLLDGRTLTIEQISNEFENNKNLWVYSFDFKTNSVIPGKIKEAKKTRLNAELIKITLDNDEYLICTPDHNLLLKDGTKIQAQDLKYGDSLAAIYKKNKKMKGGNEYEQIYQPNISKWEWTHSMVDEYFNGKLVNNGFDEFGKFSQNNLIVRHHVDFNRFNNNPNNLLRVNQLEHCQIHSTNLQYSIHSEESRRKSKETHQTEEFRIERSNQQRARIENNPDLRNKLRDTWLSFSPEQRSNIVKSGITPESIAKIRAKLKGRDVGKNGRKAIAIKYPNGRTDMQGSNSVRWIERPRFEDIVNFAIQNDHLKGIKANEFAKLFGDSNVRIREVLNSNGYTYNQFLNQYFGFSPGRPKDLKIDYIEEIALNCETFSALSKKLNISSKTLNKIIIKQIDDFDKWIFEKLGKCYNHKVIKIEFLENRSDTYNLEIDDENHNFLISAGIVIKNSNLAAVDIRFARTIERIQKIFVSEFYKIALIHLISQGFESEDLLNFELTLTNPSLVFERQKTDVMTARVDLSKSAREENPLLDDYYLYKNQWGFSDEEIEMMKLRKIEDAKFQFRLKQIVEEGNDPEVTGKSFGTPHDIATMQVASKFMPGQYGETNKSLYTKDERENNEGKPDQHKSSFETRRDQDFGDDPTGRKDMNKMEALIKKFEKYRPKTNKEPQMLSEENLLINEDNYN